MARPKRREDLSAKILARRMQDMEAVNLQPAAACLETMQSIEIVRAGKTAKHDQARRQDAFLALRDGMGPGHYDAVRRLERDLLVRAGAGDRGPLTQRVDRDRKHDFVDVQVRAGERVDKVMARLGKRDQWLIQELLKPASPEHPTWRDVVYYITGEANPHAQAAVVRMSVANLFLAYREVDGLDA